MNPSSKKKFNVFLCFRNCLWEGNTEKCTGKDFQEKICLQGNVKLPLYILIKKHHVFLNTSNLDLNCNTVQAYLERFKVQSKVYHLIIGIHTSIKNSKTRGMEKQRDRNLFFKNCTFSSNCFLDQALDAPLHWGSFIKWSEKPQKSLLLLGKFYIQRMGDLPPLSKGANPDIWNNRALVFGLWDCIIDARMRQAWYLWSKHPTSWILQTCHFGRKSHYFFNS